MAIVNLRDFYPWYTHDELLDVPDIIAAELIADKRYHKTYGRGIRRNKVYFLDEEANNMISALVYSTDNPEVVFEMKEQHCQLCQALNSLSEVQGRRVEAYYTHGKSQREVAEAEGVSERNIRKSINKGLSTLKEYLKDFR